MSDQDGLQPWEWPETRWRELVGHVRAGRPYRPTTWPGGARCAVALSFDSDHETNELRDGGKSIGRLSWGQYGNRVGVPRILRLLARHGVKATFYVPVGRPSDIAELVAFLVSDAAEFIIPVDGGFLTGRKLIRAGST